MMTFSACLLAVSMAAVQGDMTSTPEEFQEFGELNVGRWSGDVTLIADWPGMKKKAGEKLIAYSTVRWIADRKGFIWESVGGEITGFELWLYDPIAKRIRWRGLDSEGGYIEAVVWKVSATKWGVNVIGGGLADGRKHGGEGHLLFKDGGKTLIYEGSMTLGGKKLPKLRDVYTRLDK